MSAVAMLLGMGANAQDKKDIIWEMDFEGGTNMFIETDPASVAGQLDGIEFIGGLSKSDEDADHDNLDKRDPSKKVWVDTAIVLHHNISPMQETEENGRHDSYSVASINTLEEEEGDETRMELTKLGVPDQDNNNYFLRYVASPATKKYGMNAYFGGADTEGVVEDYNANMFVRSLPIEEGKSYRVSYYMRYDTVKSFVDVRVLRGWFDSEKPFAMKYNPSDDEKFIQNVKGSSQIVDLGGGVMDTLQGVLGHWQRYTFMTYYNTAEMMDQYCQNEWYWSTDSRKPWNTYFQALKYKLTPDQLELFRKQWEEQQVKARIDEQGDTVFDPETGEPIMDTITIQIDSTYSTHISQPDNIFLRFAFRGPATTYDVDNIGLYESTIGAAEYIPQQIRVNFGYSTNMASLCSTSSTGTIEVPNDMFTVTYLDSKDALKEVQIENAEFHKDGMVYLWPVEDLGSNGMHDLRLSFTNSTDPLYQLKYEGSKLFPYFNEEEWVKAGKVIKDFKGELMLPADFYYVPGKEDMPPAFVGTDPENKSFGLPTDQNTVSIILTKKAFVGESLYGPIMANIYGGMGDGVIKEEDAERIDLITEENDSVLTFSIPQFAKLYGTYTIELTNVHAALSDGSCSDFANNDEGIEQEIMCQLSWNIDAATWERDNDPKSSAALSYKKVADSFKADTTYYFANIETECSAMNDLKSVIDAYVPEKFFAANHAPSAYDTAKKVLDDQLAATKEAVSLIQNFQSILDEADTVLVNCANLAKTDAYKELAAKLAEAKLIDTKTADAAKIQEMAAIISSLTGKVGAIPSLVAQAKALYDMSIELGNDISGLDIVKPLVEGTLSEDSPKLVNLLKLEAKKALYTKLASVSKEGEADVEIDASGFITNPYFYASGRLDVEVQKYTAQYHGNKTSYRLIADKEFDTAYPGWTVKNSISQGWGGPNPFGLWLTKGDYDWDNEPGSRGGYVLNEGDVMPGSFACDWGITFDLKQTVTELPAGTYTLIAPVHFSDASQSNELLIANSDTTNTTASDYAKADTISVTTTLAEEGNIEINFHHNQSNTGLLMYNMILKLAATKDAIFDYAGAISELDKQIGEIVKEVKNTTVEGKAVYYNLNGVQVAASDLVQGTTYIVVKDGEASKILF